MFTYTYATNTFILDLQKIKPRLLNLMQYLKETIGVVVAVMFMYCNL